MTNATHATAEDTAKLFNIVLVGDKYEFTGVTKDVVIAEDANWAVTYRQIRALKDFQTIDKKIVKAGTLGGWLAPDAVLDQNGSCWVDSDSYLSDNAIVKDDALITNSKIISGMCAGTTHLTNSHVTVGCRLYNVSASDSCLSNIVMFNTIAKMTIANARVKNVKVADAKHIIICNADGHADYNFNGIYLADGVLINSTSEFAYLQLGEKRIAIYPIMDGADRKFGIFTRGGAVYTPHAKIEAICTMIRDSMHLTNESASSETHLF